MFSKEVARIPVVPIVPSGSSVVSRQILLNRDPDEATSVLLETCDSLMKGLDAARYSDNMRLYSEIYDLLIKTAALIDRLRAQ